MSKANPIPPEIVDYLDYNPETGILTWKVSPRPSVKVGQEAGSHRNKRYLGVRFKQKDYGYHRIAYFIYHGVDPLENEIDHIDGNSLNNKIDNLRLATRSQNVINRQFQKNNKSGVVGVHWEKKYQKWQARISYKNKKIHLGYFDDIEEAKAARIAAEKKYFGEYRNDCNER